MTRSRTSSAYSPRPTQRRRYLEPPEMNSENDSEGVSRTNPQLDGNTSTQSTSTIPKLLPFECIPALNLTYAEIREDVKRPVPRICRWKTKFNRQQAPPLEQILHAIRDSTNIKSILVPTLEEQKAKYMKGRRNFLHAFGERVQGRDRENPENIIHEQSTPQEGITAAKQTKYPPSNPTVNESISPQASSHFDNSMVLREIQALKQTEKKICTEHKSRFSQLEKLIIENGNRIDMLTNIVSRFVQQQSETWKCRDRGESSGGGGEHSRGVDVRIIVGGDIEAQNDIYAPTDICFGTEINVERYMKDSHLNEIFY
ncbi:hypothetical protein TIFTF001_035962 [Ficus carica]|uniref:Uncharacterized protein n=1 Tax=Ficus carica TaxID=3494 RepID=A0AA88EBT4_FICCA|nr:hypothetical protein TIFTF001_035962 [Ficus carica]